MSPYVETLRDALPQEQRDRLPLDYADFDATPLAWAAVTVFLAHAAKRSLDPSDWQGAFLLARHWMASPDPAVREVARYAARAARSVMAGGDGAEDAARSAIAGGLWDEALAALSGALVGDKITADVSVGVRRAEHADCFR